MFKKVDCIRIHVEDISKALEFYQKGLGHEIVWRRGMDSVGVRMRDSDTEIVLVLEDIAPEVDLMVDSVEEDIERFTRAGGKVVTPPFDIPIGKCAILQDPWGNNLVILDTSKGVLKTDAEGNVIGNATRSSREIRK